MRKGPNIFVSIKKGADAIDGTFQETQVYKLDGYAHYQTGYNLKIQDMHISATQLYQLIRQENFNEEVVVKLCLEF